MPNETEKVVTCRLMVFDPSLRLSWEPKFYVCGGELAKRPTGWACNKCGVRYDFLPDQEPTLIEQPIA
ncbi:MAG: hypothetical protein HYT48_03635 [Candidatus Vogelbacteria bacterium]|nr:hypothetical protein [Candidatus Vogelbacteria bacterium]